MTASFSKFEVSETEGIVGVTFCGRDADGREHRVYVHGENLNGLFARALAEVGKSTSTASPADFFTTLAWVPTSYQCGHSDDGRIVLQLGFDGGLKLPLGMKADMALEVGKMLSEAARGATLVHPAPAKPQ